MILFFEGKSNQILALSTEKALSAEDISKLQWLFSGAEKLDAEKLTGYYVGPRK